MSTKDIRLDLVHDPPLNMTMRRLAHQLDFAPNLGIREKNERADSSKEVEAVDRLLQRSDRSLFGDL